MSGLLNMIGWSKSPSIGKHELIDIFPFPCGEEDFVSTDVESIFNTIFTEVLERTTGIKEEHQKLLWDNCVASDSHDGLVTMLSKAIMDRQELFLVYDPSVQIVRKATPKEETQIREDYKKKAGSDVGVYISFKNFKKADMIKIWSAMKYFNVASLYKMSALTKAIQVKLNDLRKAVGHTDKDSVLLQAAEIAKALSEGKDVALDGGDSIETATVDLSPTKESVQFVAQQLSFYLGMPASWIAGIIDGSSLGDSGEREAKAVERGLRKYYFSVIAPVINALFGVKTSFRTEDYYGIQTAVSTLTTFEATSEAFISKENKTNIINGLFRLPEGSTGDEEKVERQDEKEGGDNGKSELEGNTEA